MKGITMNGYWLLRKDIEICNIEIEKVLNDLAALPAYTITSKVIYDVAQIVVSREHAEKITKAYEERREPLEET